MEFWPDAFTIKQNSHLTHCPPMRLWNWPNIAMSPCIEHINIRVNKLKSAKTYTPYMYQIMQNLTLTAVPNQIKKHLHNTLP